LNPIALFGGSFDPVHYGHLGLARAALTQLEPQKLILLPAGNPYQKGRLPIAPGAHRVNMLRLAFQNDADVIIDERELHRTGATYTFDTLLELRAEYGARASLVWLIGGDAFARLDTWHRWRELFGLAHFAVVDRPSQRLEIADGSSELRGEIDTRIAGLLETHTAPSGAVVILGMAPPPVSSTEIRRRLALGESVRDLTRDTVCDYIDQHRLYRIQEKNQVGHQKTD
jgi:nicotinate-nucleotide adenylyltransferase